MTENSETPTPPETTGLTIPIPPSTPPVVSQKTLEELQKEEETAIIKQIEAETNMKILQSLTETLKNQQEQLDALRKDNRNLIERLDIITQNTKNSFIAVAKVLETQTTPTPPGGQQEQKEEGGVIGIINKIVGAVEKGLSGEAGSGAISPIQKQILETAEKTQLIYVKKMLKDAEKMAGVSHTEDHVVVSP